MNEELKYCKFCNKQKPKKDFCKSGGFTKNICRECHNKNQKERYANSKLVEEKDKEIERLNKRVKECEEAYLRTRHQYSELEGKYVINDHIINELEKWIEKNKQWQIFSEKCIVWEDKLTEKINELKGDSSNE